MIGFFPYSLFVIAYSFHFYGTLHQHIYRLTIKDTKDAVQKGYVFTNMENDPISNIDLNLLEEGNTGSHDSNEKHL